MKILIAFYSWTGHTEMLAKTLGERLEATVVRIEPVIDPGQKIGRQGMKALFGQKDEIKPILADLAEVDHLVVMTPVWSFNLPPYTRRYLSELTNCSGKKFSILAEMGGSGGKRVVRKARAILEGKGMSFVASAETLEKDVDAGKYNETLEEFAKKIQTG
jgi:flavodoxin